MPDPEFYEDCIAGAVDDLVSCDKGLEEGTIATRARWTSGFTAVIGGGGAMAIGISAGILMALKEAGLDVADASAAIGTSAGSTVAADVQLGVPLDEIAARVCTDRPDDRDVDRGRRSGRSTRPAGDDPCVALVARARPSRRRVDLGAHAGHEPGAGAAARATRHRSGGQFPGAMLSLGESHDWASEFYPEAWPDRRICAVASDLDSGRRVMLEADPRQGHPARDIAPGTAGVVCDPRAVPAGARRRGPTRRRWTSVGDQSRPGGPAAVPSRAGHQRNHVRPRRSAERPGSAVADVAESHGAPRGGVPAAPRPRGVAASSRTRRARTRRHDAVLRTDHERHRRGGVRGRPATAGDARHARPSRTLLDRRAGHVGRLTDLRRLPSRARESLWIRILTWCRTMPRARLVTHHIAC